jgi:hypothetical protein
VVGFLRRVLQVLDTMHHGLSRRNRYRFTVALALDIISSAEEQPSRDREAAKSSQLNLALLIVTATHYSYASLGNIE